jgi:hypothetical protein
MLHAFQTEQEAMNAVRLYLSTDGPVFVSKLAIREIEPGGGSHRIVDGMKLLELLRRPSA